MDEKLTTLLTDNPPPVDNRVPYPKGLDFSNLYCHDTLPSAAPIPTAAALPTVAPPPLPTSLSQCVSDTDCIGSLTQPFCVDSSCRECRSLSDCADPSAKFCNRETQYTCSSCQADSDCGVESSQICRSIESQKNRKTCVPCSANIPPKFAILTSPTHCASWKCPENQMVTPDGNSCTPCPACKDGQFLIPGEFFTVSTPPVFYPQCDAVSVNAKCIDCPSNVCASPLSPSFDYSRDPDVGHLPPSYPCGAFKCNPGWFLDKNLNQCRLCQLQSCEAGKFLNGCGGASPGTCLECPPQLVATGTPFIDPKSLNSPITNPSDVCRPKCSSGFFLSRTSPSTPWQCANCDPSVCPPGTFLSGCGPGENPGQCLPCASAPPPNWFWTPNNHTCAISQCTTCGAGSALIDCGGPNAGSCAPCPFPLPTKATAWTIEFDNVTMTNDSCAFNCGDGSFRKRDDCVTCKSCPIGEYLEGCTGRSPGHCKACPAIGETNYFISPSSCKSSACPQKNEPCQPGEFLSHCGGGSPGTCTACNFPLPPEAERWLIPSDLTCDFECKPNFFPSIDTTTNQRQCIACSQTHCPIGTRLVGCSNMSPGTCEPCPTLQKKDSFYQAECEITDCSSITCGPGEILLGCGGVHRGTCTACDSVRPLPANAHDWLISKNECIPDCKEGFYLNSEKSQCVECSLSFCRPGYVLTECSNSNPGRCVPCESLPAGQCFTGPGTELGAPGSCSVGPCRNQQL